MAATAAARSRCRPSRNVASTITASPRSSCSRANSRSRSYVWATCSGAYLPVRHGNGADIASSASSRRTTSDDTTGTARARLNAVATVDLPLPLNPVIAINTGRTPSTAALAMLR